MSGTANTPAFNPTSEQLAIVAAVGEKTSTMCDALAGCSKTTTIAMASKRVRDPALALVFNKRNQVEMQPKLPGNFKTQTMNGLGFGSWTRANQQVNSWNVEPKKLGKLVTQLGKDRKMELTSEQWDFTHKLVSGAMLQGIVPGNLGEYLTPDEPVIWRAIGDDLGMVDEDFEYLFDLAREALEKSIALAQAGTISFDDQVYCPTVLGGKFPLYPFVATDESQDLNLLNHRMVEKTLRADARLLVVGDPKQSIYQFRGACQDSMEKMLGLRRDWKRLPLATTFRCPKVVVERQQRHAPGFTAFHTNKEGSFHRLPKPMSGSNVELEAVGWSFADLEALRPPGGEMAVLCRNNGPLMSLAFKLLRQGIGVSMLGRDIGKGLISLSRKIAPEDGTPTDITAGLITDWRAGETSKALANGQDDRVSGIVDRSECLQAALENAGVRDAGGLRRALALLFSRDSGLVTLGSGHRSKGMEWNMVVHLDPWRLPSKYAKEAAARGYGAAMEQEMNLLYVMETRTRDVLVEVNLRDFADE